jgi:hypothetical protein
MRLTVGEAGTTKWLASLGDMDEMLPEPAPDRVSRSEVSDTELAIDIAPRSSSRALPMGISILL